MNSTKYAILTDNIEKAEIQLLTNLNTDLKEKGEVQISYDGEPVDFVYLDDDCEINTVTIDKIKQDGVSTTMVHTIKINGEETDEWICLIKLGFDVIKDLVACINWK